MQLRERSEKQLWNSIVYEKINYNKKIIYQLVDSSHKYFEKRKEIRK